MATAPSMAKDGSEAPSAKTSLNTGVPQRDSRHAWLGAAALIFALSTTFALTQKPRSNPLQPVQTLSTDWWLNPIERNAFKRLPAVAGRLEAVHASKDGHNIWAVGSGGLIIHSPDGGLSWQRQAWTQPKKQEQRPDQLPAVSQTAPPTASALQTPTQTSNVLREFQSGLRMLGLYKGPIDGFMNDELRQAIRTFQQQHGMTPDGEPGQKTRAELNKALNESRPKSAARNFSSGLSFLVTAVEAASPAQAATEPEGTASLEAVFFLDDALTGWAAGENGLILHTSNGGESWGIQSNPETFPLLTSIVFSDAQHGWAISEFGAVLKTVDGGMKWEGASTPISAEPGAPSAVVFTDVNNGWLAGKHGQIFATTDGGANWHPRPISSDIDVASLSFTDARTGWAATSDGTILRTTDAGDTWQTQRSGPPVQLSSIVFTDPQQGWAVGRDGTILETSNGGNDWIAYPQPASASLSSISFANKRTAWVVGENGTILNTADGGQSWNKQTPGDAAAFASLAFVDQRTGWSVGGNGAILHTTDGGSTWIPQRTTSNARLLSIVALNAQTVWTVGEHGTILHTTDAGTSWLSLDVASKDAALYSITFAKAPAGENSLNGWIFGEQGQMLQTGDGGKNWTPVAGVRDGTLFSGAFGDLKNLWAVGTSGTILHTADRGVTWRPQENARKEGLSSTWFTNAKTGWAVGIGGIILNTVDGEYWTPQTSGTTASLMSITFVDSQTGWAVGDAGTILHTKDGGKTWQTQTSGSKVTLTEVVFTDVTHGWVSGSAGVILRTDDGGQTWIGGEKAAALTTYARYPAPWWYLALFGGLYCATMALRPPRPVVQPVASVADLALSDKPIETADRDVLSFRPIALGLSNFLRNSATEPPVTLAITGDWGSGKSSLMNLLLADLRSRGFQPVWFNAWHQQKDANLLGALIATIRAQALPPLYSIEGLRFRLQLVGERIRERPVTAAAMTFLAAWSLTYFGSEPSRVNVALDLVMALKDGHTEALLETFKSFAALAAGLPPLIGTIRALRAFGVTPGTLANSVAGSLKHGVAETKVLHDYARQFRDVTRALDPRTLTVFIDDLDRCTPERVREALEGVNYLVSSGPCFVVLGMARERVEACVGLAFKDVAQEIADLAGDDGKSEDAARRHRRHYARDYLKKLINIEVPVPEPTDSQTRDLIGAAPTSTTGSTTEPTRTGIPEQIAAALIAIGQALKMSFVAKWPLVLLLSFIVFGWWAGFRTPGLGTNKQVQVASSAIAPTEIPQTKPINENKSPEVGKPGETNSAQTTSAELVPGQTFLTPRVAWIIPALLLVAFAGGVYLQRPQVVEQDSKDFRKALAAWLPLVAARQNTPREVKRYVNRMRLLAMRQRAESSDEQLDEHALVALGALHHLDESVLENVPPASAGNYVAGMLTKDGHSWGMRVARPLDKAIADHMESATWPPPPQAIRRFRQLMGSVQINQ